jgi:hypothetical protein
MGVDSIGVTKYIAEVQRVLEKSGLEHKLHGYGTGSFSIFFFVFSLYPNLVG